MSSLSEYYINLIESCEDTRDEYDAWLVSTFDKILKPVSEESDTQHKES